MQTKESWMRRVALAVAVAASLVGTLAPAAAQSATGLRAGARWSQLDGGGNVEGTVTGLVVGGYFGFGLSDRLALQLEAVYGGRGADAVTFGTEIAD
ncbi:MAG: hypothetical protein GWN71_45115, partial [Gammaproteobacteria bacterium]|nr:hypothetical protein [Gemmatimonadota bacterium]NIU80464.1 hypothetical protein [Gammaproteobacteria bacterium]